MRNLINLVAFCITLAAFWGFFKKKLKIFFSKNQSFFSRRNHFFNVLRNLTNSVTFCIKLAAFSGFQRNSRFFPNNQSCFRKLSFWTCWCLSLIQWHSTANLPLSTIFRKVNLFSENLSDFFRKKLKLESFEEIY